MLRPKITYRELRELAQITNEDGQPTPTVLADLVRSVRVLELNVKAFGYDLARRLAAAQPPRGDTVPQSIGLRSKPATQADMESDWAAHWMRVLGIPNTLHRKLWEFVYVLQTLHDAGHLRAGARGLGFGCGREPLPSYLASLGIRVTATDLEPDRAAEAGWIETHQHAATPEDAFIDHLVDRATFDAMVEMRVADMNAIPADLVGYDFCWSMCAAEHLGSIDNGLAFVERALDTVRPGGLSVHTIEHNLEADGATIDNWPTVLFQRRHIEALAERLTALGHHVAPLDFDAGNGPMDRFVDLPPWGDEATRLLGDPHHIKISVGGFPATSFGIAVTKAG